MLFGPGQCGKSTILNMVAGFEMPSSGELLCQGKPIEGPGPERGMVFQNTALFPWLTVMGLSLIHIFTYARTAMQYQASAYILKNELSPELVRSEIEKLRKKRHQRVALHEVRRASRNEFLKKLIGQENEGGALRIRPEELRTNQIELENRAFAAAIFMSDAKNYQTIQRAMYGHFENPIFCAYSNCTYMLANLPYG